VPGLSEVFVKALSWNTSYLGTLVVASCGILQQALSKPRMHSSAVRLDAEGQKVRQRPLALEGERIQGTSMSTNVYKVPQHLCMLPG